MKKIGYKIDKIIPGMRVRTRFVDKVDRRQIHTVLDKSTDGLVTLIHKNEKTDRNIYTDLDEETIRNLWEEVR